MLDVPFPLPIITGGGHDAFFHLARTNTEIAAQDSGMELARWAPSDEEGILDDFLINWAGFNPSDMVSYA